MEVSLYVGADLPPFWYQGNVTLPSFRRSVAEPWLLLQPASASMGHLTSGGSRSRSKEYFTILREQCDYESFNSFLALVSQSALKWFISCCPNPEKMEISIYGR